MRPRTGGLYASVAAQLKLVRVVSSPAPSFFAISGSGLHFEVDDLLSTGIAFGAERTVSQSVVGAVRAAGVKKICPCTFGTSGLPSVGPIRQPHPVPCHANDRRELWSGNSLSPLRRPQI